MDRTSPSQKIEPHKKLYSRPLTISAVLLSEWAFKNTLRSHKVWIFEAFVSFVIHS